MGLLPQRNRREGRRKDAMFSYVGPCPSEGDAITQAQRSVASGEAAEGRIDGPQHNPIMQQQ